VEALPKVVANYGERGGEKKGAIYQNSLVKPGIPVCDVSRNISSL
jgi:hypothetical protein